MKTDSGIKRQNIPVSAACFNYMSIRNIIEASFSVIQEGLLFFLFCHFWCNIRRDFIIFYTISADFFSK